MAAVKGSKQLKMVVVPYRPWRTWWAIAALLSLLVLTALGAFLLGHYRALVQSGDALVERDLLRQQVVELEAANAQLQGQVLVLEQSASMDKEVLSSVQSTIVTLREQISQLEEDVLFYKQIVSPDNDETGLVIGQLDLVRGGSDGVVRYKLELKQQGSNDSVINGFVNVNVLGLQDNQEISLPLRSLSDAVKEQDIKLQFRYFQNIEGEMSLPAGFEPQKVQILAVAEGDNAKTVQKSFGWLVQN